VNSRLKERVCLGNHKVTRLLIITVHCLLCLSAMLLNAVAAAKLGVAKDVRSMILLAK
jgi:hypothetical protein